ncbi:15392_t:CDS:2, partial [Cetraspora pellucida]
MNLANKYSVEKSTILDILKEKEHWLAITTEEEGKIRKFHMPKWSKLKEALGLWMNNMLNSGQDIDRHILKEKAKFFIEHLLINNFHQFAGWLTGFKKCYRLHQFKKEGKSANDESNLLKLIDYLPTNDSLDLLTAYEYIHAEDNKVKNRLTKEEILEIIESEDKNESEKEEKTPIKQEKITYTNAENCITQTLKFLYEQGPEFGEVKEEVKILRKFHKQ